MKLDTSRAWQEATAMVSGNRDVLLALAGVFLVLPSLALALLFPTPEVNFEAPPRAVLAMLSEYFRAVAPWQILNAVVAAVGVLALLTLFTDPQRPTVGSAIGAALRGTPSYIATMLISATVFLVALLLISVIAAASGSPLIALLLALPAMVGVIYIAIRWNLAGPVIAAERQRNPFAILQRSWQLTEGNAGRIFVFLFLLAVVYMVVLLIGAGVLGGIATVALGQGAGRLVSAVVGAVLGGVFSVYITASLAAIHRQLSGATEETARRFD